MILQGGLIKVFLCLDRGWQSRKKEEEKRRGREKGTKGWGGEGRRGRSLYVCIYQGKMLNAQSK